MKKRITLAVTLPFLTSLMWLGCSGSSNPSYPGNTPVSTNTSTSTPTNLGGFTSTFTVTSTDTLSPTPTATPTFCMNASHTPCTATITFTPTHSPTATVTVTPTATLTGIVWSNAIIYQQDGIGSSATLDLEVSGQPVSTAGVTLSGSFGGSPVALVFQSVQNISGQNYGYYLATGFNWQPGQTYSLTTVTTAGTASATLMAPGTIAFSPADPHGAVTQVVWGVEGNNDRVLVLETAPTNRLTFNTPGADADSPLSIPGSAYPDGNGSVYNINVYVENHLPAVIGAVGTSSLTVGESNSQTVTLSGISPTATFTSSPTPTNTPTGTASFTPTFTGTPTKTQTPTVTFSFTNTATINLTFNPTATNTPTSVIDWNSALINHVDTTGISSAYLYLAVNGLPVTTAGVTLSGSFSGSPVAMPSDGGTYPIGPVTYGYYYTPGNFNWQPGQTYILSTVTTAGTAAATFIAPGGITFAPLDSHGAVTQVNWAVDGTGDFVNVYENSPTSKFTFKTLDTGEADSPVTIPSSGYPDGTGSVYSVNAHVEIDPYPIHGAMSTSSLEVYENSSATVTWN